MSSKYIIPEGTRDLIPEECFSKKKLQNEIEKIFDKWGYNEIVTPTIEFYQTFNSGFQNLKEEEVYKFFDTKGRILVLRPDMTIPIARVVATKFKDVNPPIRFRYCSSVFRMHADLGGKRNEYTDCGVELVGLESEKSDLEILVTALDTLEVIKNTEYKLEIGDINFFNSAIKDLNISEEQKAELAALVDKKSLKSLENYLDNLNIDEKYREFFIELPWLFGGKEAIEKAKKFAFNDEAKRSIEKIEKLSVELSNLGYDNQIIFDFGMVPRLNYYTGLMFRGFIEGAGATVLSGGRYDKLISTFGRDIPAVGFSANIDTMWETLEIKNKIDKKKIIINYGNNKTLEAIKASKELRKEGNIVELIPVEDKNKLDIIKDVNL